MRYTGIDQGFALPAGPNRRHERRTADVLGQKAPGPGDDGLEHRLPLALGREHDDLGIR